MTSNRHTPKSNFELERILYLRPVQESKLPEGKIWMALKPLYGIPEAGLHWYLTYCAHHKEKHCMTQRKINPCVFFKPDSPNSVPTTIMLRIDDSLGCGSNAFLTLEDREIRQFLSEPREIFNSGKTIRFNGFQFSKRCETLVIKQSEPHDS